MAARVTKATLALKNSIPLIAKDDGKEESHGGFEKHTHKNTQRMHRIEAEKNTRTHDFVIWFNLGVELD